VFSERDKPMSAPAAQPRSGRTNTRGMAVSGHQGAALTLIGCAVFLAVSGNWAALLAIVLGVGALLAFAIVRGRAGA